MFSQNHHEDKSYFAIRFDDKRTYTIATYAMDTQTLANLEAPLEIIRFLGLSKQDTKALLQETGATITDYNNPKTGLVHPAAVKYNRSTHSIRKITFANNKGEKSDPAQKLPAMTTFIKDGYELRFFKNGMPQDSYLNTCIKTEDVKQRNFSKIMVSELLTGQDIPYRRTFKDNYNTLFELLENPSKLIAKPDLQKDQQIEILKHI